MKTVFRKFQAAAALFGTMAAPAFAGSYIQDFSGFLPDGVYFGDGSTLISSWDKVVAHLEDPDLVELQLTQHNIPETRSAFLLPDLDPGNRIYAFSANWTSPLYGNYPDAGEGFSFSFGPLRALDLIAPSYQQEAGYGTGLTFSVKTGPSNPGYYLYVNNAVVAYKGSDPAVDWGNYSSTRHQFQVDWDEDTGLTVWQNGAVIFENVFTDPARAAGGGGFRPQPSDSFVWAARSSQLKETFRVDNIAVTTVAQAAPTLHSPSAGQGLNPEITLSADVNTRGAETTVTFEIGTDTTYGVSAVQILPATTGLTRNLTQTLPFDTDRSTPLHVRITASNALGTVTSGDFLFQSSSFENYLVLIGSGGNGGLWADVNDDGLLDVITHGKYNASAEAAFYINRGAEPWTVRPHSLGYLQSFASLGDFDNDNRPDVFFTGVFLDGFSAETGGPALITYGVASDQLSNLGSDRRDLAAFPFHVAHGHSLVEDFDHDGRQDILFTGSMAPFQYSGNDPLIVNGVVSRLMRNEYQGTRPPGVWDSYFDLLPSPVRPMGWGGISDNGFLSKGNLNGDGFADIYSYGFPDPDPLTNLGWEIFRNDGENGLAVTQQGNRQLGGTTYGASCNVWADFNGDGLDDLVVAEGNPFGPGSPTGRVLLLLNDGQGRLVESEASLARVGWTSLAVGDIFNHGRNDIILMGVNIDNLRSTTLILRNEGNGAFTQLAYGFDNSFRPSPQGQGIALADYDGDGRLDFCQVAGFLEVPVGTKGAAGSAVIYRNELDIPANTPPQAPANPSAVASPGKVTFSWESATDDITPAKLLTYNVRVGKSPLDASVVSPLADVVTGWRKVAEPGNCRHTLSTFFNLPPGTYYWSVQAIDGAFAGGAWAPEGTFTIPAELPANTAPQIACGSPVQVDCTELAVIRAQVTDPDEVQTLTVTLKAGDEVLDRSVVASGDGVLVEFSAMLPPGVYDLTLVVSDGTLSDSCDVTVTVTDRSAPSIAQCAPNQSAVADSVRNQALVPDFTALPMNVTDCTSVTVTQSPLAGTPAGVGSHPITLRFTDEAGNQSECTATFTVTAPVLANRPPSGTDKTISIDEGTSYTFSASDFGFSDPDNAPAHDFLAVKITTLPASGSLQNNGTKVKAGKFVTVADINLGRLKFTPAANGSGTPYATFTFQVQDNGGIANRGIALDQSPNTMTINVADVNTPPTWAKPASASYQVKEGQTLTFTVQAKPNDSTQTMSYSLVGSVPDGATIDPTSGVFTWTPNMRQGPADYTITFRATEIGEPTPNLSIETNRVIRVKNYGR